MKTTMDVNLYAYGNGAQNFDCEKGSSVLKNAIEKSVFADQCCFSPPLQVEHRRQQAAAIPDVIKLSEQLAQSVQHSISNHRLFITLGGDHTAAIGAWSGAANAVDTLGLIWFDAHMDSHTFKTSPSKNSHGMPLAILLGHGEKKLTQLISAKPKLKPENVVLMGVRSFEKGEADLLKKLGVKIFYSDEIKKLGIKKVIQESITIVTRHANYFGISIDLDGFDPIDAPGVGTPAPDGIRAADFLPEFTAIAEHPQLIGADIVEFNPVLDVDCKTEQLAMKLFEALMNIRKNPR